VTLRRRGRPDAVLTSAGVGLALLGALMVFAATRSRGPAAAALLGRQLVWVAAGALVMAIVAGSDLGALRRRAPTTYALTALLLVGVLSPLGSTSNGTQAWFDFGPLRLQPSELAKPVLILALASFGARARGRLDLGRLAGALLVAGMPLGLVLLQPDLGTGLVLLAVVAGMVYAAGARPLHLVALALLGLLLAAGALRAGVLAPYQVDRLTAFLRPGEDPRGSAWNLAQAKIAIGSGGLTGAGLFQGGQTRGGYVPEAHTDFVFTVVGEELGFAGAASLLALFALVVWRTWRTALLAPDLFGTLCCVGVLTLFVVQVFENAGMTMGLVPITGVPLPFVSYGGSSMMASFAGLGLVANVSRRR
jgi:rod shape determining protein RodA